MQSHIEAIELRTEWPTLRVGRSNMELYIYDSDKRTVDVLVSVRKLRYTPLQVTIGDDSGISKLKLDSCQFQSLVASAQSEQKERETARQ